MKFIIPVLVGAIIGYITNWLAIKMLFRPYEKKYIFGIPVPFTPGLIPKEQKRIARSVGETVGEYLLSEEIIMEQLEKAKIDSKLKNLLNEKYLDLKNSNISIREIIDYMDLGEYEDLKILVSNNIMSVIMKYLKNEDNKTKILNGLDDLVDSIEYEEEIEKIRGVLLNYINNLEDSRELEYVVREELLKVKEKFRNEDRELRELVDMEKVELIIDKNSYLLVNILKDCIDDFTIADKVKDLLNNIIENNMSKTIRMFVSPDGISEKIYRILESYIYEEDFEDKLKPILISGVSKLMEYRLGDIVESLDEQIDIESLSGFIVEKMLKEDNKNRFIRKVGDELLVKEDVIVSNIKSMIHIQYDKLLENKSLAIRLYNEILNGVDIVANKNLSSMLSLIDDKYVDLIIDRLTSFTINIINTKTPKLVSTFNVAKVVEDEINKFEVDFAEEIILDIASKELKAITWLGALLGAIMGIISPLLQMIGN